MIWLFVFVISIFTLFWSGSRLVKSIAGIAKYLGWSEFVVAFFIVAFVGAAPNFFVGVNAALQGLPELSFGEIVGGTVVDMTLAVALAILISGNAIPVKSKMVQDSAIFTAVIAILPLFLILDGGLARIDGMVLMLAFAVYMVWLFSKEERFRKKYEVSENGKAVKNSKVRLFEFVKPNNGKSYKEIKQFKSFLKDLLRSFYCAALILVASFGVVASARVFAGYLGASVSVIGILVVGLGNAFPETYFAVISALKRKTWMILGDLMGTVIVCSTFVLGLVVLINPIENVDLSPFIIARVFLLISALLFLLFVKTDRKITKTEAVILLSIYLIFLFTVLAFQ